VELSGALPMVWGAGEVGPVAALRTVAQLAENAKTLAVVGALPEAHHNQVVVFDGALAAAGDEDLFRDRIDDRAPLRLRLVLLHDDDGSALARQRSEVSIELAERHGVGVSSLRSEGTSAFERLASLVGLVDYATVYLALAQGIDPTPITAIDQLKAGLRARGG
jgi:glucose/mannose-6-phosphate isomerase